MTKTHALIPVKELEHAKARLAPVLDETARRELVLAMLRDVLDAMADCRIVDEVAVISRDAAVLSLAQNAGVDGLPEPGDLNEALTTAVDRQLSHRIVILAGDLPLADAASISTALTAPEDVVVVPSRDGGTNLLVLPSRAIDFQFGPDSARKHLAGAEAAGLRTIRLYLPRLAFDIDTPEDVERLRNAPEAGRHTRQALERIGLFAPPTKR